MKQTVLYTHSGQRLTKKENEFINVYIETGNASEAYRRAYKVGNIEILDTDSPEIREKKEKQKSKFEHTLGNCASKIRDKPKIAEEIIYRQQLAQKSAMITVEELYNYLARVVRGEEKDQFGLDVPISERTRAATELLKRMVDIPAKLQSNNEAPEVKITLDWKDKNLPVIDADIKEKEDNVEIGMLTTQVGD